MERCIGYAQKINELYIYDCGLGDWLIDTQFKGTFALCGAYFTSLTLQKPGANANGLKRRGTLMPSVPSTQIHTPQTRHPSGTSMMSEATFPRRPDATIATDLSLGAKHDTTPPTALPVLPYPSLAKGPSRSSSATSGTPPSSMRPVAPAAQASKTTGFFASLGRKASLKKDKPGSLSNGSSPSTAKIRSKSPSSHPNPRPINIPNNPSVPGGPRAPPNRAARSQTIMISSPFSSNPPKSALDRGGSLARSPSLFTLSPEPEPAVEFARQVDKLAVLLPQADRSVLAGYLRRAGQDILAIGQYLEDEKNGTIRRH
jgi:hypothetical protein